MSEKKFHEFTPDEEGFYFYPPFIPGFKRMKYFNENQNFLLYSELEGVHVLITKPQTKEELEVEFEDVPETFDYPIIANISNSEYFDDDVQIKECATHKEFIEFLDATYLKFKGFTLDEAIGL